MEEIKKGDKVTIKAQGIKVTGIVYSATFYNNEGWHIELIEANIPGGYSYWKQNQDGGTVEKA